MISLAVLCYPHALILLLDCRRRQSCYFYASRRFGSTRPCHSLLTSGSLGWVSEFGTSILKSANHATRVQWMNDGLQGIQGTIPLLAKENNTISTSSNPFQVTSAGASSLPQSCHTLHFEFLNLFLFVVLISSMAEMTEKARSFTVMWAARGRCHFFLFSLSSLGYSICELNTDCAWQRKVYEETHRSNIFKAIYIHIFSFFAHRPDHSNANALKTLLLSSSKTMTTIFNGATRPGRVWSSDTSRSPFKKPLPHQINTWREGLTGDGMSLGKVSRHGLVLGWTRLSQTLLTMDSD